MPCYELSKCPSYLPYSPITNDVVVEEVEITLEGDQQTSS